MKKRLLSELKHFRKLLKRGEIDKLIEEFDLFLANSKFVDVQDELEIQAGNYNSIKRKVTQGILDNRELISQEAKFLYGVQSMIKKIEQDVEEYDFHFLKDFILPANKFIQNYEIRSHSKLTYLDTNSLNSRLEPIGPISKNVSYNLDSASESKSILILGEYGSGKTSFAYKFCYERVKDWLKNPLKRLPFILQFKNYNSTADFVEWILLEIRRETDVEITKRDFIKAFFEDKFMIILDGLDELSGRHDLVSRRRIIRRIVRFAGKGSPVVLTCRTNFFESKYEIKDSLGKFDTFYISEFDDNQVFECVYSSIKRTEGKFFRKKFERILRANSDLYNLSKKPLFLQMIYDLYNDSYSLDEVADQVDLYRKITYYYISRELRKSQSKFKYEVVFEVVKLLAYKVMKSGQLTYYKENFDIILSDAILESKSVHVDDIDEAKSLIVRCLLIRQRSTSNRYKFTHLSIIEFLIADLLTTEIFKNSPDKLNDKIFYEEIFYFIEMIIRKENQTNCLLDILNDNSNTLIARVNVIPPIRKSNSTRSINSLLRIAFDDSEDLFIRWVCSYSVLSTLEMIKNTEGCLEFALAVSRYNIITNNVLLRSKLEQIKRYVKYCGFSINPLLMNEKVKNNHLQEILRIDGAIIAYEKILLLNTESVSVIAGSLEI